MKPSDAIQWTQLHRGSHPQFLHTSSNGLTSQHQLMPRSRASEQANWPKGYPASHRIVPFSSVQFSSVQFKIVSMRSGRPICAPPRHSESFPNVAFENSFNVYLFIGGLYPSQPHRVTSGCPKLLNTSDLPGDASRVWWLLFPPVYLLCHFL